MGEKEKLPTALPTADDVDRNIEGGHEDTGARKDQSGEVAQPLTKKSAADVIKGSGLSPGNQEKALKLVEPIVESGIPSGIAAIGYVAKKLEHEMLTNENAKNSRFIQAAYALCKIFGNMFNFAFTAGDYASLTSALYPTEKIEFNDDQFKEFLAKRTKLELLDNYQKTKDKLGKSVDDKEKKDLQQKLESLKDKIKEKFGPDADPDALCKEYLAKNKEQLTKEELDKFKDSEDKDAQISAYYVQKQLNILGLKKEGQKENYDPDSLHASLQKTAYEGPSKDDPSKRRSYSLFEFKEDLSELFTSLDTGTAIPGTVVFFRWNLGGEKTASMCGIVGLDGKLRFHDSKKLHTFGRDKSDAEKYEDSIRGNKDEKDSSEDADLNALSGSLLGVDLMPTTSFAGAFIPRPKDLGPIEETAEAGKKAETEEKKPEPEKPAEAETKSEPEKPAETPPPSQS